MATRVPLDYRCASVGRYVGDPDGGADARNLLGPGLLHREFSRVGKPCRAPQIDSARAPVDAPFARPLPQGFGPVPPFWSWRQAHAGTYDEAWQAAPERRLPDDFDCRFYQSLFDYEYLYLYRSYTRMSLWQLVILMASSAAAGLCSQWRVRRR